MQVVIGIVLSVFGGGILFLVFICLVEGTTRGMCETAIQKMVEKHLGEPAGMYKLNSMQREVVQKLQGQLSDKDKALNERDTEIKKLKETLDVWKEGITQGYDADTIAEQVRWIREKSGIRDDSAGRPGKSE